MMLMTGMLISGKMSVAILRSANGVASRISIAITMNVYGRRSASSTTEKAEAGIGGGEIMRVGLDESNYRDGKTLPSSPPFSRGEKGFASPALRERDRG